MDRQEFYLNPDKAHEIFLLNSEDILLPRKEPEFYIDDTNINLPKNNKSKYLRKDNYLCEFLTEEDKETAISNLGLDSKLELLKSLIDTKIFLSGNLPFDLVPIEGHNQYILSSDALYKLILNYYTKEEIDTLLTNFLNIEVKGYIDRAYYNRIYIDNELEEIRNELSSISNGITGLQELHAGVNFELLSFDGTKTNLIVHVNGNGDILKEILVQVNGTTVIAKNELTYSTDIPLVLTENSIIRVIVQNIYNRERAFTKEVINDYFVHKNTFYIGGGITVEDIFQNYSPISYEGRITGNYDILITTNENRIIIIVPKDTRFDRADMNGIEIPFTKIYRNNFMTLISENRYQQGIYNIDINS